MGHDGERVRRGLAALDALEAAGTLDRRTPPAAGDRCLVFRGGRPSVEDWPVADGPGVWVVGVLGRG